MALPTIEGWRPMEPHHPSRCDLCNDYIEPRQKMILYSPVTKKLRHSRCHDANLRTTDILEVWSAEVRDEDEEGDYITVTRNVVISTLRRQKAHPRHVKLLTKLAEFPTDTPIKEIRAQYQTKGHYDY